jgi:hypothetical protein
MKTVYLYDAVTGAYAGVYEAQESPLEPGVFIEPIFSTDAPPPTPGENQIAIFAEGAWSLQDDYIGQTVYDQSTGASEVVEALGALPIGFALTPPPPTLAQVQATQIATLTAAYNVAIQQPVPYKSQGGITKTYQATLQSVANLTQMLLAFGASATVPFGFYWVSADNTQVPFTYADMQGLAVAFGTQGAMAFQILQTLKAQVKAPNQTVAGVQVIVWPTPNP